MLHISLAFFGNSLFREVWVSSHAPLVCCQTCDSTTIAEAVHYSPAEVTSCVFVCRHLRWTWFEFSCLCIFSCHDSHKHLHERCGFGLWICCLMGELAYIWHTDAFQFIIHEALCLLIMCLFLSKRERLPPVPITVCLSVGRLSEGFCINAVTCQWHGLETRTLSRSVLLDIEKCKSESFDLRSAFSCIVAGKEATEEIHVPFIAHQRDIWHMAGG